MGRPWADTENPGGESACHANIPSPCCLALNGLAWSNAVTVLPNFTAKAAVSAPWGCPNWKYSQQVSPVEDGRLRSLLISSGALAFGTGIYRVAYNTSLRQSNSPKTLRNRLNGSCSCQCTQIIFGLGILPKRIGWVIVDTTPESRESRFWVVMPSKKGPVVVTEGINPSEVTKPHW